jgi:ferredoxin
MGCNPRHQQPKVSGTEGIDVQASQRIWIESGCIQCGWCQNLAPQVFLSGMTGTLVQGSAREDGVTSDNACERSPLRASVLAAEELAFLPFVADGCPVRVIHLDGGWSNVGVADPAATILG